MLTFRQIEQKLIEALCLSDNKQVADILGYNSMNTYNKAVNSDAIPLKKILDLCIEKRLDATAILYGDHSGKEIISRAQLKRTNTEHYHVVPYFEEVNGSCGDGCFNDQTHSAIILLPKERYPDLPEGVEAIHSWGDSMLPLIQNQSIVLFKRQSSQTEIKNTIYVFSYEGELYIKLLNKNIKDLKKVNSISLNQSYTMRELDKDKVKIIGEFVSTI